MSKETYLAELFGVSLSLSSLLHLSLSRTLLGVERLLGKPLGISVDDLAEHKVRVRRTRLQVFVL